MKFFKKLLAAALFFPAMAFAEPTSPSGTVIRQVQDEGAGLTRREKLNFTGSGITCVDNAGNLRTDCTITAGGGGASSFEVFNNFDGTRSSPTASIGLSDAFRGTISGSTYTFRINFSSVASQSDIVNASGYRLEPATVTPRFDLGSQFGKILISTSNVNVGQGPFIFVSSVTGGQQFGILVSSKNINDIQVTAGAYFTPGSSAKVDLYAGDGDAALTVSSQATTVNSRRQLRLGDSDNSNYAGFVAPTILSTNLIWRLPLADASGCLASDGSGNLSIAACGGGGGGGSSALEVFSNFDGTRSSPTASIAISDALKLTVTGSTAVINVDFSSVTAKGNTFNTGSNLVELSGGLIPNALVDGSSVTKQGLLVAGSNITLTPGAGTLTIASSGGGSGSSIYPATSTAIFPYGVNASTGVFTSTLTALSLRIKDLNGGTNHSLVTYKDFGAPSGGEITLNMDNGNTGPEQLVIGSTNTNTKNIVFNGQNTGVMSFDDATEVLNWNKNLSVDSDVTFGTTQGFQFDSSVSSVTVAGAIKAGASGNSVILGLDGNGDAAVTLNTNGSPGGGFYFQNNGTTVSSWREGTTNFSLRVATANLASPMIRLNFPKNSQKAQILKDDGATVVVEFDPIGNSSFTIPMYGVYGINTATATLRNLTSQSCIGTDSSGNVIAGTCGGGGGSSTLAVGTGTASNFTTNVTSPTAAISFLGSQFNSVAGGTTNFMTLNQSSVTLEGKLVAGSNITLTPGAGTLTIASSGGGSGSTIYNATSTAGLPYGFSATTATFSSHILTPHIAYVDGLSAYGYLVGLGDVWLTGNNRIKFGSSAASAGGLGGDAAADLVLNGYISDAGDYGIDFKTGGSQTSRMRLSRLGNLSLNGFTSATPGLTVKGAASQSAPLMEWKNSSDVILSSITAGGVVSAGNGLVASTITIPSLPSQSCVGTDSSGLIIAGSCGGGGGSGSPLEVFNNFDATRSSPTLSITASDAFRGTVTGSTYTFRMNTSSVTLYGPNIPASAISAGSLGSSVMASSVALSGFYSNNTVRSNLGLAIGTNVQAWDTDLDDLADGSLTGSKVGSGVPAANIAAGSLGATVIASSVAVSGFYSDATVRSNLGLAIGTNVQAWDADLDDLADGSLTGSKVGSGVPAANIASGSLGSSVLASSFTATGVTAGSYTLASVTVDAQGRLTSASSGSGAGVTGSTVPITIGFSGGGSVIAAGVESSTVCVPVPYALTISSWTVIAPPPSVSGSISVTMRKATYANFPTFSAMSAGGNQPSLTSTNKNAAAVSGWTSNSISAGDIVCAEVTSATSVTRAVITLWGIR